MSARHDPDTYAKMAAPYASKEEAEAALRAFDRALRRLRAKHRIAEVVCVAAVHVENQSKAGAGITQLGDSRYRSRLLRAALQCAEVVP